MTRRLMPYGVLLLGGGSGATQPLTIFAVDAGYHPLGMILWQLLVAVLVLGALTLARGRSLWPGRQGLPICAIVALCGTVFPNSASYLALGHLPAGVMAIIISSVPMLAIPLAMALGMERFSIARLAGLGLGLAGIALIALPSASLPEPGMAAWLPVALIVPAFYALEANLVAKRGTAGLDPIQLLFGASVLGLCIVAPLALATGEARVRGWPLGGAELSFLLTALIHAGVYSGYVWLVSWAGSVFAAQCSYIVTGAGMVWSMLLLGEHYAIWIWLALVVMLIGVALVQPRREEAGETLPPVAGDGLMIATGALAEPESAPGPSAQACTTQKFQEKSADLV